jgi:beta-glucosidase
VNTPQPYLETRNARILEIGDKQFKDLNKNGTLDPYEDWGLSADVRIADLISQMTLEE